MRVRVCIYTKHTTHTLYIYKYIYIYIYIFHTYSGSWAENSKGVDTLYIVLYDLVYKITLQLQRSYIYIQTRPPISTGEVMIFLLRVYCVIHKSNTDTKKILVFWSYQRFRFLFSFFGRVNRSRIFGHQKCFFFLAVTLGQTCPQLF